MTTRAATSRAATTANTACRDTATAAAPMSGPPILPTLAPTRTMAYAGKLGPGSEITDESADRGVEPRLEQPSDEKRGKRHRWLADGEQTAIADSHPGGGNEQDPAMTEPVGQRPSGEPTGQLPERLGKEEQTRHRPAEPDVPARPQDHERQHGAVGEHAECAYPDQTAKRQFGPVDTSTSTAPSGATTESREAFSLETASRVSRRRSRRSFLARRWPRPRAGLGENAISRLATIFKLVVQSARSSLSLSVRTLRSRADN